MNKPVTFEMSDNTLHIVEKPLENLAFEPIFDKPQKSYGWIFWSAISGLFSLVIFTSLYNYIEALFVKTPWLGWVALALTVLLLLSSLVILYREWRAIREISKVSSWHDKPELDEIYAHLAKSSGCSKGIYDYDQAIKGQILNDAEKLILLERVLIPLDKQAVSLISQGAKRVSMVTAVSPKAIVDIAMVSFTIVRLLRQIATLYGLRPGTIANLRLLRLAFTHIAVTAGLAAGDTLISQFLGAGLAGRLSAKLGEGVINGLMTARFGLAAQAICRPMKFSGQAPKLQDVVSGFMESGK